MMHDLRSPVATLPFLQCGGVIDSIAQLHQADSGLSRNLELLDADTSEF